MWAGAICHGFSPRSDNAESRGVGATLGTLSLVLAAPFVQASRLGSIHDAG